MKTIIVIWMLCGRPDTIIVKRPDLNPVFVTNITEQVMLAVKEEFKKDPIVIIHEDKRIKCI